MKCSEVRTFLSQISDRDSIDPIPLADLNYLTSNGYVLMTSTDDYAAATNDLAKMEQLSEDLSVKRPEVGDATANLEHDVQAEHSFMFHFEGKQQKEELALKIQTESKFVSDQGSQLTAMETNLNQLIQEKSLVDRMVPYGGGYVSVTGVGTIVLNDLVVRDYRVSDEEFPDFVTELKATYAELRGIADRAETYVAWIRPKIPDVEDLTDSDDPNEVRYPSILWSIGIGLGKLQGDPSAVGARYIAAFQALDHFSSTTPNKLMAAEIMTALSGQDLNSLVSTLTTLDKQMRSMGVPKELSAGVAATIMAGRSYQGAYPTDRFQQFRQLTPSFEAAAILAVMYLPYQDLATRFQSYRAILTSWGYMGSEDVEIAAAYLAIGELDPGEVVDKMKYIVTQLSTYLEYPLVAAAILASIPVFESHEVLDLMEKAVTLLSAYAGGLERSELVALAVRMIHGVRNEIVKEVDPTAPVAETPVQFTYAMHPGFFFWYAPVILAHSTYHATFSGIGGFHPGHSHGIGGFAG